MLPGINDETVKDLARTPLGIIALFIVLIYGFSSLIVGYSGELSTEERLPLIWFLVIFPFTVLFVFTYLVKTDPFFLYSPTDLGRSNWTEIYKKRMEAGVALFSATNTQQGAYSLTQEERILDVEKVTDLINEKITGKSVLKFSKKLILWVDDNPDNNRYERMSLEAVGLKIILSTSTDDAINKIRRRSFDAIISDMGRPPDSRAGYTLLGALRDEGNDTPFIIYAGSRAPEHIKEAKKRGAIGTTNRPDELFEMVLATLE